MSLPVSKAGLEERREYLYRMRWRVILMCIAFFGAGAVVLGHEAATNRRGLIFKGIPLTVDQATDFYWLLTAAAMIFVLAALFAAYQRLTREPARVVLTPTALIAPKRGFRVAEQSIGYGTITELKLTTVKRQVFLTIRHSGGKLHLARSLLPSPADFDEIHAVLDERSRRR